MPFRLASGRERKDIFPLIPPPSEPTTTICFDQKKTGKGDDLRGGFFYPHYYLVKR